MVTTELQITGMSCGHCINAVRKELGKIPGVHVLDVQIGSARVSYDPKLVNEKALEAAITEAGYALVRS